MSAISIQQMADRIAALMETKLRARGTGLSAKLRARGSALPRKVYTAATALATAAEMAQSPKLLLQIDHEALARNYDICTRHLSGMKPRSGWMDNTLAVAASIAMSLLLVALLVVVLMRWRGLL
jgi:hypothetical protein